MSEKVLKQDTTASSDRNAGKPVLLSWNDLEPYQKDNHYILSGYRRVSRSYNKCAESLLYLHNESVNIFSHLIGAVVAATTGYWFCTVVLPRYKMSSPEDVLVFSCFFFGAVGCLGMSATYHAILSHSEHVARFANKLDYLGIVLLIWGSFMPSIYYGFACEPDLVRRYWAMISTIGAGCAAVSLSSKFATPKWRPFRAGMFSAMGLSAVVPVLHGLVLHGLEGTTRLIGLPWLVLQGLLYLTGAALYAARIPERFSPGRFDIWGSSHQIFHVMVLLAACSHMNGLTKAFDFHVSDDFHCFAT